MTGLVAALTVIGFLVTAWSIVAAYLNAKRALWQAPAPRMMAGQLAADEQAEMEGVESPDQMLAISARYEAMYAEKGLIRATWGNLTDLHKLEAERSLLLALEASRDNLLTAGFGLLVSTIASVWSGVRRDRFTPARTPTGENS